MTSHDVVSRLRKITGERSIGHLGTLDPMATGVLPLLIGRYTRLAQYFSSAEKSYSGTIRFGFATDTYDAEGKPAGACVKPRLTLDQVREVAVGKPLAGEPGQVSAPIKVSGIVYYIVKCEKKSALSLQDVHSSILLELRQQHTNQLLKKLQQQYLPAILKPEALIQIGNGK